MAAKLISMVCNCLSKVACVCTSVWAVPSKTHHIKIYEKAIQEWKRIEGIDQYYKKRP